MAIKKGLYIHPGQGCKLVMDCPDGLYLSASHFMNPDYSDDRLVFHRFDLLDE